MTDLGIELRSYPAAKWASTTVEGKGYDAAVAAGFWRLFKVSVCLGGGLGGEGRERPLPPPPLPAVVPPSSSCAAAARAARSAGVGN